VAIGNVGDGGYNSAAASGGTASLTLAFPASIATGHLVLASVCVQGVTIGSPVCATPTGWTKVGNIASTSTGLNLYLFAAIYAGGLTGVFAGSGLGTGGMDGEIRGLSGTGATVGAALGNFTSVASGIVAACAIPGPSGFTSGQWNYWCSINNNNLAVNSTSPVLSNVYYNAGADEAFEVGTTAPGSAPGTETITWASAVGDVLGVGVTVKPAAAANAPQSAWWPNEAIRRPRQVDRYQSWDLQPVALRSFGTIVPTIVLPPPWFDPPKRWVAPPGFEPTWTRNYGILVPTVLPPQPWFDPPKRWIAPPGFDTGVIPQVFGTPVKPSEPWFDPPKRWNAPLGFEVHVIPPFGTTVPTAKPSEPWFYPPKRWVAPPGFEAPPWRNLGTNVPQVLLPEPFWVNPLRRYSIPGWTPDVFAPATVTFSSDAWWSPYRQTIKPQVWDSQPLTIPVVQPAPVLFTQTDWWFQARRSYSTLSWDGNLVPLAVILSPPDNWWTLNRQYNRPAIVWDSQTPQPFGTTVPITDGLAPWFDPPKRWIAPPGFEAPPWRNLGTAVPTTKPSEPWFDPPQRWSPRPWFEVTWFQNYGIPVPTAKPSEPWFDPPKRWNAPPGFEPHTLKPIIPGTATPSSVLPTPWFDPPKRWVAPPGFEPTWTRNYGILVPTAKPSEPWFDPPKRWVAPPGFEPTWVRPFGTQVPTSVPPPEWWTALRRAPPVSTWSPDVFRPLVAAVVTPSFVSAEWWLQVRRQASVPVWDSSTPLLPSATPPFFSGSEWWQKSAPRRSAEWWGDVQRPIPPATPVAPPFIGAEWWHKSVTRRRAEWWDFIPPGARLVPFMDQAWWGLTARGRAADWWRDSPLSPPVGVSSGWQTAFFDPKGQTIRAVRDWALGPFFAYSGVATFIPPLEIVAGSTQAFIVECEPAVTTVSVDNIVSIVKV